MDRVVDAGVKGLKAPEQRVVRRVDDRIDFEGRDVPAPQGTTLSRCERGPGKALRKARKGRAAGDGRQAPLILQQAI
ncbi:hypothetical protein D3C86_2077400 [compost metagenome]